MDKIFEFKPIGRRKFVYFFTDTDCEKFFSLPTTHHFLNVLYRQVFIVEKIIYRLVDDYILKNFLPTKKIFKKKFTDRNNTKKKKKKVYRQFFFLKKNLPTTLIPKKNSRQLFLLIINFLPTKTD